MTNNEIRRGVYRRSKIAKGVVAGLVWLEYLRELRRWKSWCAVLERRLEAEEDRKFAKDGILKALLRRLAGLNPNHGGRGIRPYVTTDGKVGYRSCNESNWENSVRAIEEDR